jgi:UDPglucose 6-dehydrogenase
MLPVVGVWGIGAGADQLICKFQQLGYHVIRNDQPAGYKEVSILFIWIDLPILENGQTNVTELWKAVQAISDHLPNGASIVLKSPLPVGTGDAVQASLHQRKKAIDVVICSDWTRDKCRLILGGGRNSTLKVLRRMLSKVCLPILVTTRKEAEFISYAIPAFFAVKRGFMNQLLPFCDEHRIDVQTVARSLGLDPRIGQAYLSAGIHNEGQGILAEIASLLYQGDEVKTPFPLLDTVQGIYDQTMGWLITQARNLVGSLQGKSVAVWAGLAEPILGEKCHFALFNILDQLLLYKSKIRLYDPFGEVDWKAVYGARLEQTKTPYDAARHADLLLILVSHPTLASVNLHHLKKSLKTPLIIDGAYMFSQELMESFGYAYHPVGRKVRT